MDLEKIYRFRAVLNRKDLIDFAYLNANEPFNMVVGWSEIGVKNREMLYEVTAVVNGSKIFLDMLYALKAYGFETI